VRYKFRKFSYHSIEFGDYEHCYEVSPEKRSGAFLVFDAYPESPNYFAYRIYHFKKDQEITVKSEGCTILERKCKRSESKQIWYDESDEEKEVVCVEYMTTIAWKMDDPINGAGHIEVDVVEEYPYFICEPKVSWKDGVVSDFSGFKANLSLEGNILKINEVLTNAERRQFALDDRIEKLKGICRSKGLFESYRQLDLCWIQGGFRLDLEKEDDENGILQSRK
tara:strand:+ start:153 stop:821 length:669 start_codon:yes stop_codon:yes gene_type:complete